MSESSPIRRILAPSDLSETATAAVRRACDMLSESGGELVVLHVVVPDHLHGSSEEENQRLLNELDASVPLWAADKGIHVETKVIHRRELAKAICEQARELDADLICMGSRGRTGITRALLGSVTEGVLRNTTLPLLVVPPPTKAP